MGKITSLKQIYFGNLWLHLSTNKILKLNNKPKFIGKILSTNKILLKLTTNTSNKKYQIQVRPNNRGKKIRNEKNRNW